MQRADADHRRDRQRRRWRYTEPAVLLLLRSGPSHGYELSKRLPTVVPGLGPPPDAAFVYRILRALEADGAVRSYWQHDDPGPARRMYVLTPAGGAELEVWRAQLTRELKAISGFLEEYLAGAAAGPPADSAPE